VGTTDAVPLAFRVDDTVALRLEPGASVPNVIGGFGDNSASGGVQGAAIGGGGASGSTNRVTDDHGTVGGGINNQAGNDAGATSDAAYATVGGGEGNIAAGAFATVPGGLANSAEGDYSLAAGRRARANHPGAFVWADAIDADFASTADNQFVARATGGFKLWVDTAATGLRLFPVSDATWGDTVNVLAGHGGNNATGGVVGATVSGGGWGGDSNSVQADFGTIGGGQGNLIGGAAAHGTVAGGQDNVASDYFATVGGGSANLASGSSSTVAGGWGNSAGASGATVPGGIGNAALGDHSFAAGWRARANHSGAFVWADAIDAVFASTADNQFVARATGGFKFWVDTAAAGLRLFPVSEPWCGPTVNVLAGHGGNNATGGVVGATVGGGGRDYENNSVRADFGTIGGGTGNIISSGSEYGTVGGGTDNTATGYAATVGGGALNAAGDGYGTVGGGAINTASGDYATVGGGTGNTASDDYATVGGGADNAASGIYAAVGGGTGNTASGDYFATVGGGTGNTASGYAATVPGGEFNTAHGIHSFAAGWRAKANNEGCFVWADSTNSNVTCSSNNRTIFRSSGGFYVYSSGDLSKGVYLAPGSESWAQVSASDRNLKENFAPVDGQQVLARLADVPINTWNYMAGAGARHMSPVAQDFYAAFQLGEDDKHLSALDTNGVALAAIQGLHEQNQALAAENSELRARVDDLETRLGALERAVGSAKGAGSNGTNSSSPLQGSLLPGAGMLVLVAAAVWGARRKGDLR
jgi:hypothetical protein